MSEAKSPERLNPHGSMHRVSAQLRKVFGLRQLRPGQREVIHRVLRGLNTLAVMPTGAGKSLCYQLPATLLPGITLVVSPLIALMQDQCDKLIALGISAVQLNSALSKEAARDAEDALANGRVRIVFTTPERLTDPELQATLMRQKLALLVVDEAHCISQWGHDFRPAFIELGTALKALGSPSVLALTATANEDVTADIARLLGIPTAGILSGNSFRPNLEFSVEPVADESAKLQRAVEMVSATNGPVIVYVATVKAALTVHEALLQAGLAASLYHGKLTSVQRQESQQAFMTGQSNIMVATNAFGLGIDKPDIRLVLHFQLPAGLDVYYQEAGRAGRDGASAQCTLLFLTGDRAVQQFFLNGRYPTMDDGDALLVALRSVPPNGSSWTLEGLKEKTRRAASKLRVLLNLLRQHRLLRIDETGNVSATAEIDREVLESLLSRYVERSEQDQARLEQIVAYALTGACRWRSLLNAFGDSVPFEAGRCRICDNCRRMLAHERQMDPIVLPVENVSKGPRFAQGDAVRVKRYGAGTVVEASTESVTVDFASAKERRCFHPDFVILKRSARSLSAS